MPRIAKLDSVIVLDRLCRLMPLKAGAIRELFGRVNPVFIEDLEEDQNKVFADSSRSEIHIGRKCTVRLHAQAMAAGAIAIGLAMVPNTPEDEHERFFDPANRLFNWAVGQDIKRWVYAAPADIECIFPESAEELPPEVLSCLTRDQIDYGHGLFKRAIAWVILHELAHLDSGDYGCKGVVSIEQEKNADWFATNLMMESADSQSNRINKLSGIAVALLWITVSNVYRGRANSDTHPEGYDRLFQVLDRAIDSDDEMEYGLVWGLTSLLIRIHMRSAGFDLVLAELPDDPREQASVLIDMISRRF